MFQQNDKTKDMILQGFLLNEVIFFTTLTIGFEENWQILTNLEGEVFTDINEAIVFVRERGLKNIGLAEFDQMQLNNAQWDNF